MEKKTILSSDQEKFDYLSKAPKKKNGFQIFAMIMLILGFLAQMVFFILYTLENM